MNFRLAKINDCEYIFPFWRMIFQFDQTRARVLENYIYAGIKTDKDKILIMEDKGELIGTVCNQITSHFYEDLVFKKSDVGYVAIHPEYQGRGLGHKLMQKNQELLRELNVDIARLGGLTKFYSRFGYVAIPSVNYTLLLELVSGGRKKIPPEAFVKIDGFVGVIKELTLPDQIDLWASLHNEFWKGVIGAEYLDKISVEYWKLRSNENDNIKFLAYFDSENTISAYILFWEDQDKVKTIFDLAGDESSLILLLKHILSDSLSKQAQKVNFNMHVRDDIISSIGLKFIKKISLTQSASSMLAIINLDSFLDKLSPLLFRRISNSTFANIINIHIDVTDLNKTFHLKLTDKKNNSSQNTLQFSISYSDLIHLIFSYTPPYDLKSIKTNSTSKTKLIEFLNVLFPYTLRKVNF